MMHTLSFEDWIDLQGELHHSDGCTWATGARRWCCKLHDLEWRTGKGAVSAYLYSQRSDPDPWGSATPTTFERSNDHFAACLRRKSPLGYYSPFAAIRLLIVRSRIGRRTWDRYRAAEAERAPV